MKNLAQHITESFISEGKIDKRKDSKGYTWYSHVDLPGYPDSTIKSYDSAGIPELLISIWTKGKTFTDNLVLSASSNIENDTFTVINRKRDSDHKVKVEIREKDIYGKDNPSKFIYIDRV